MPESIFPSEGHFEVLGASWSELLVLCTESKWKGGRGEGGGNEADWAEWDSTPSCAMWLYVLRN